MSPFPDVITKAALSSQVFKEPEYWSGRGLNLRPPAQQTNALLTKLTRWQLGARNLMEFRRAYFKLIFAHLLTLLELAQFYSNPPSPWQLRTSHLVSECFDVNPCYSFSGSRTPVNVVIIRSSSLCLMDVRRFVRNEVSSRP